MIRGLVIESDFCWENPSDQQKKTCGSKQAFDSAAKAHATIQNMRARGMNLKAYRCSVRGCGKFHLTSQD